MRNTKTVVLTVLTVFLVLNGISQFFAGLPTWVQHDRYDECGVDGFVCDPTNWVQIYVGLISFALAVGTGLLASTEHEDIVAADREANLKVRTERHQQELDASRAERDAARARADAVYAEDEYRQLKAEEPRLLEQIDTLATELAEERIARQNEQASGVAEQNTGEEQV